MPKYIIIAKKNKSIKPWKAHTWGNDLTALRTVGQIDETKIRHFDCSIFDKKIQNLKVENTTTGEEIDICIIQLYSSSGRTILGRKVAVKKAAAKKAARKK